MQILSPSALSSSNLGAPLVSHTVLPFLVVHCASPGSTSQTDMSCFILSHDALPYWGWLMIASDLSVMAFARWLIVAVASFTLCSVIVEIDLDIIDFVRMPLTANPPQSLKFPSTSRKMLAAWAPWCVVIVMNAVVAADSTRRSPSPDSSVHKSRLMMSVSSVIACLQCAILDSIWITALFVLQCVCPFIMKWSMFFLVFSSCPVPLSMSCCSALIFALQSSLVVSSLIDCPRILRVSRRPGSGVLAVCGGSAVDLWLCRMMKLMSCWFV